MKRRRSILLAMLLTGLVVPAVLWLLGGGGQPPGDPLAWAQVSSCGNAILEPPEVCDPPGSNTCPSSQCNLDCTCPPLDHFLCYEVKRSQFSDQSVTVQDQFGTMVEGVRHPTRLCNPTDKNQEGITDPTDHLTAYATRPPRFEKRRNLTVSDQFGSLLLDALRPDFLMVPTSKDGVQQEEPLDHFQCYKVKRSRGAPKFVKRTVSVVNQFETTSLQVLQPRRLCAPANKSGEDPTAPGHPDHLICYKTRGGRIQAGIHMITDQFGSRSLEVIRREELCVPALKNEVTTTTTSTTSTSTTTSTTSSTTSTSTTTSTTSSTTSSSTTTSTTSSTTTTSLYGSPSRAFLQPVGSLLE